MDSKQLENVNNFIYLKSKVINYGKNTTDIKHKIA